MQQILEGQAVVSYSGAASQNLVETQETTWMYINGTEKANTALLDAKMLSPFETDVSPPPGDADRILAFTVNQTDIVTWVLGGDAPFNEPSVPILNGNTSTGWNATTTFHLPLNATIDLVVNVADQSLDTVCPTCENIL